MILTDTHTHLYLEEFDRDREEVMSRAEEAGIERIFLPNIDSSTTERLHRMVLEYPGRCFPMMGLHPCSVQAHSWERELTHVFEHWLLGAQDYSAVGEIGIDLHWDRSTLEVQVEAFRRQIQFAIQMGKPIVIHCRESFDEIFRVLEEEYTEELHGIFHCFTGTREQAHRAIDLNMYLGIGGVYTFRNSGLDREIADIPLDKIVLETDAPYLAPVPRRGKRNETAYLRYVAEKLADDRNISLEEVADITTRNSKDIFGR